VEDDGMGAAKGSVSTAPAGLGQRIIAGMADKIDGELRYEHTAKGARAVLSFPITNAIRVPIASRLQHPSSRRRPSGVDARNRDRDVPHHKRGTKT
jgi:hypothetical protein